MQHQTFIASASVIESDRTIRCDAVERDHFGHVSIVFILTSLGVSQNIYRIFCLIDY